MGSIPGVVVGALVLIGLPGLLREFEEYRLLIYGAALVVDHDPAARRGWCRTSAAAASCKRRIGRRTSGRETLRPTRTPPTGIVTRSGEGSG